LTRSKNSRNLAAGDYSAFEKREDGDSKGSPQAANPKRRNVERNAPLPEAPSEVCKAGVSDCVGPAASSSDFGSIRSRLQCARVDLRSLRAIEIRTAQGVRIVWCGVLCSERSRVLGRGFPAASSATGANMEFPAASLPR